jgi:hypothetical protein
LTNVSNIWQSELITHTLGHIEVVCLQLPRVKYKCETWGSHSNGHEDYDFFGMLCQAVL